MVNHKINKLPKNTLEITVDISPDEIEKEYQKTFEILQKELAVQGFRKGKVPKTIAEKHISKESVYQELLKTLIPRVYREIVDKEGLKPVVSPKIELVKAKDLPAGRQEKQAWQILIKVAEKPEVILGDYKKSIKEAKEAQKKDDIWVPGKDKTKPETKEKDNSQVLNIVLAELLKKTNCEISDLIVEGEVEQRLARMVDDIQKIGLTVEAYLKSKNITVDQLKSQYRREIEDTYKLEFILSEIADKEDIKVEPAEIDKLFVNIKEEKEKAAAKANSYFYAMIIRKQKTLDFLIGL